MVYDDFKKCFIDSEVLKNTSEKDFKDTISKYPFFRLTRWLYLKFLSETGNSSFEEELKKTALHATNRRNLYYFIYPEKMIENEPNFLRDESSGSYFDILQKLESKNEDKPNSLKSLAEKLKNARKMIQNDSENKNEDDSESSDKLTNQELPVEMPETKIENFQEKETEVKILVKNKKYREALEILEELNLINPKKSVYFADQIRFLRKIIENQL
jgi:hypothetical protein